MGMVILGYESVLPLTRENILRYCQAVARGTRQAHFIGDMLSPSYQVSISEAMLLRRRRYGAQGVAGH